MSRKLSLGLRWVRLVAVSSVIAVVWLIVLPRIALWPQMQERINRHSAKGINVDAMFYTELGPVEGFELVRVERDGERVVEKRRFTLGSTD